MANYDPTTALAEVLAPQNSRARPMTELPFHQGVITSWDAATGENIVNVVGSDIENIPMLNIGDTTNLRVGDIVALLKYRNAYFIIGRIVIPDTTGFASSSFAYDARSQRESNFIVPATTATVQTSVTAVVPDWSNYGLLTARLDANALNVTGARDTLYASIDINGSLVSPELLTDVENNRVNYVGTSYTRELNFLSPGPWTINGLLRTSNNPFAASTVNVAYISATILYLRR